MFRTEIEVAEISIPLRVFGPFDVSRFRHRFGPYEVACRGTRGLDLFVDRSTKLLESGDVVYPAMKTYATNAGMKFIREGLAMWVPDELTAEAFVHGPAKFPSLAPELDAGDADTPLRILSTLRLLHSSRGAFLHGCGYAAGADGAFLFAGASGAGKTTIALGLPEADVLSDDQVAITFSPEGFALASSTPFVGMYGRTIGPRRARLRGIVLLDRTRQGDLSRVSAANSATTLLGCVPLYVRNSSTARAVLNVVSRLVESVPVFQGSPDLAKGVMPWISELVKAVR